MSQGDAPESGAYDSFMDELEARGFPHPRMIVPVLAVLAIAALAFYAYTSLKPNGAPTQTGLAVLVQDSGGSPVAGATVSLLDSTGAPAGSAVSDAQGTATFSSVPPGPLSLHVTAANYLSKDAPLSGDSHSLTVTLSSQQTPPKATNVQIAVTDGTGTSIPGASVSLRLAGDSRDGTTDSFGLVNFALEALPTTAGISATAAGYQAVTRTGISSTELASSSSSPITIVLTRVPPAPDATGLVRVTVTGPTGTVLTGVTVALVDAAAKSTITSGITAQGVAEFPKVSKGTAFTVTASDPTGAYSPYVGGSEFTLSSSLLEIPLQLAKAPAQAAPKALAVTVKGADGIPLAGAAVMVFDVNSNRLASPDGAVTDDTGSFQIALPPGGTFYVEAYADGFLPGFKANVPPAGQVELDLTPEAPGNFFSVQTAVTDAGVPAAGAKVALYSRGPRDGFFLGVPVQVTGPDGVARFHAPRKLDGLDYGVFAVASMGAKTARSDAASATGDLVLNLSLVAPPASLDVTVVDKATGRTLSGALVQATLNGTQVTCSTGNTGTCTLTFESGRPFKLQVGSPGYGDYTALASQLPGLAHSTSRVELYSISSLSSIHADFLGFTDAQGNKAASLGNDETFNAKFLLSGPDSELEGLYVRAGDSPSVSTDAVEITSFNPADSTLVLSGTRTNPAGCDVPVNSSFQDASTDGFSLKWSEFVFTQSASGSRELSVAVHVKPTAKANSKIHLYYRAFGVSNGTPSLSPFDPNLAGPLVDKSRAKQPIVREDFCGAQLARAEVPVSSSTLSCDAQATCTGFAFVNPATGVRGGSGLPFHLGDKVDIEFSAITESGIDSMGVTSAFLAIDSIEANTSSQSTLSPALSRLSLLSESTGPVEQSLPVSSNPREKVTGVIHGHTIRPAARAPVDVFLHLKGNTNTPARLPLFVRVTGTNQFKETAAPTTLTLGREQLVTVNAASSVLNSTVPDATVTFFECSGSPLSGQEIAVPGDGSRGHGLKGLYSGKLKPSGVGVIGVRVEQPDYDTFESCDLSVLAGDFLSADQAQLDFTGNSTPKQVQSVIVSQTLPLDSTVTGSTRCVDANGNLLPSSLFTLSPATFKLKAGASQEVQVALQDGITAQGTCLLAFNAQTSPGVAGSTQVVLNVNVTGPVVAPPPAYPAITSSVTLPVDASGVVQAFYSLKDLDTVTRCRLIPFGANPIDASAVRVDCSAGLLILQTSYDFSNPNTCLPASGSTGKLLISRTRAGFPLPDAAVGLAVTPVSGARVCQPPSPTSTTSTTTTTTTLVGGSTSSPSTTSTTLAGVTFSYPSLPDSVGLSLDSTGFAEAYYSLDVLSGSITGCTLRTLAPASPTSIQNFVHLDSAACSHGVLHIAADYAGFPTPPGLYRNLLQNAQIEFTATGLPAQMRSLSVNARNLNAPDNPPTCGDGVCQSAQGENGQNCPADCSPTPTPTPCTGTTCTPANYPPLPSGISLDLNDQAGARQTFSTANLPACTIASCEIKASYLDARNPATSITNFVTLDSVACKQGVVQVTADYSTFPNLYQSFVGSGSLYVTCTDGTVHTTPIRVSANKMGDLPANPPTCTDGIKNGQETGVDCGGPQCPACPVAPTCTDGIKNGDETGVDCGGSCPNACTVDLYDPLPPEIRLTLNANAFAEGFFQTVLLGKVTACSAVSQSDYSPLPQTTPISNFVKADCAADVFHVTADYSKYPDLYQNLIQSGIVTVQRTSATGQPLPPKTVRIIVSAAGVVNAPLNAPLSGLDSLPSSVALTVFAASYDQVGRLLPSQGWGFGITTPNTKTFAVHFAADPTCSVEGFIGAGFSGTGTNGVLPPNAPIPPGYSQYGGYGLAGAGFGVPPAYLSPQNYWPGGPYQNAPTITYPADFPIECQVPFVLFAPQACGFCSGDLPGLDYNAPLSYSAPYSPFAGIGTGYASAYRTTSLPSAFGPQGAAFSPYQPFSQAPYPYPQYGGATGFGSFPYSSGFNSPGIGPLIGGNQFSYSQYGSPYLSPASVSGLPGMGGSLPPSCLPPAVCRNPSGCQLAACLPQVYGGGYGISAQGVAGQLLPQIVSCSKNELSISANYFGAAPLSMFGQSGDIRVTDPATGTSKAIPLTVLVASGSAFTTPTSSIPLWCSKPVAAGLGLSGSSIIKITQENADKYGLPTTIRVQLNPITLKGTFVFRTPVKSPDGQHVPLLCDASSISSSLKYLAGSSSDSIDAQCDPDGLMRVTLDYSSATVAGDWQSDAKKISDAGMLKVQLTTAGSAFGRPTQFQIPVNVTASPVSPAGILMVFFKKDNLNLPNAQTGFQDFAEDTQSARDGAEIGSAITFTGIGKLPSAPNAYSLRVPNLGIVPVIAADEQLQFVGTRLGSGATVGSARGTFAITSPNRVLELPVISARIPNPLVIRLNANGVGARRFSFEDLADAALPKGIQASCTLSGQSDQSILDATASADLGTSLKSVSDRSKVDATSSSFAACDSKYIELHADFSKSSGYSGDPSGINFEGVLSISFTDPSGFFSPRGYAVPVFILGPSSATPDAAKLSSDSQQSAAGNLLLRLSPEDTQADADASANANSFNVFGNAKGYAADADHSYDVGTSFDITAVFPKGDDSAQRSVVVVNTNGGKAIAPGNFVNAKGTRNDLNGARYTFEGQQISVAGSYALVATTVVSGQKLKVVIRFDVKAPDAFKPNVEPNQFTTTQTATLSVTWPSNDAVGKRSLVVKSAKYGQLPSTAVPKPLSTPGKQEITLQFAKTRPAGQADDTITVLAPDTYAVTATISIAGQGYSESRKFTVLAAPAAPSTAPGITVTPAAGGPARVHPPKAPPSKPPKRPPPKGKYVHEV